MWLYLFSNTMGAIMGIQFVTFWVVVRVWEELSRRAQAIQADLEYNYVA